jgi:hypothetical protein
MYLNQVRGDFVREMISLKRKCMESKENYQLIRKKENENNLVFVIATIGSDRGGLKICDISSDLFSCFSSSYFFDLPNEKDRSELLKRRFEESGNNVSQAVIDEMVRSTEGFEKGKTLLFNLNIKYFFFFF